MRLRRFKLWPSVVPILLSLFGCAQSGSTARSPFLNAIGVLGISSPTAQASDSFAVGISLRPGPLSLIPWSEGGLFPGRRSRAAAGSIASLASAKSALQSVLDQGDADHCLDGAFSFADPSVSFPTCFGPILSYQNHPDGADGAACSSSAFPCFAPGQVGIWSAAESSGEACAAAKVNSTVQLSADTINSALRAVASLLCVWKDLDVTAPAVGGAPLELAGTLNRLVSGADFTHATLTQLPPRTGAVQTWETRVIGTLNGQTIELDLLHSPTSDDNSAFAGHFFAMIGTGSTNLAFSLTYRLTALALVTLTKFGLPTALTSDPFDVDNDLDFSHSLLAGQPVYYVLSQLNPSSGIGTAYVSWMDSNQDAYSREFQVTTTAGLSSDTGISYFGFGNALTSATDRGLIKKMICNWGGPGHDESGISGQAESQHLVRGSDGVFAADQSAITFAPTNSCSYTPGTFALSLSPAAPAALGAVTPQFSTFDGKTGIGDVGNIPVLSEPTY